MAVYAESRQAAEERLARIQRRYQNTYSNSYYMSRAFASATNRMTNLTKLRMWAEVLHSAGFMNAADGAWRRMDGLQDGTIATPQRRRLTRSTVPAYVPVAALRVVEEGAVSFVNYKFTPEAD